jgi:hypothetical protein
MWATGETVLTRWVGRYVMVKYLAGPADPVDLHKILGASP